MKKLISVLLAVVFLATALAGCGSGAKDEFQKNVEALKNDAKMNVSFMSVLMNYEAEYMKSNGIEDDTHEAEVAAAANLLYDKSVEQLKASGKDTEAATIESISDRYEEMDKLWQDINGNESGKEKYPECPSRMAALYVSETLKEAEQWGDYFAGLGRPTYGIAKIKVNGSCFYGDAYKCFDGTASEEENLHLAELYWENGPNADGREKIHELLVDGDIEILKIVKVMNANIPES